MDFQKNKKLILMAAVTAVLCIILLALASVTKKKNKPSAAVPAATEKASSAPAESSLQDTWAKYDEANELVKTRETASRTAPSGNMTEASQASAIDEETYPSPSFVSSSGDTLIYLNGVYKRVDWVKPTVEEPDTLVINGKRYVEIKEEPELISF